MAPDVPWALAPALGLAGVYRMLLILETQDTFDGTQHVM